MHYANGREAKNGDRVMLVGNIGSTWPKPVVGILHDATAGNDTCNGQLATVPSEFNCPNLAECLHIDDVRAAIGSIKQVKDTSKPAEVPPTNSSDETA